MKDVPFATSCFPNIINNDYVYVDKTPLIHSLIKKGKYYFLTRPRRFGKSLLISTLKELFLSNRELFKECAIYSSDYAWKKHPVIHIDLGGVGTSITELERYLKEWLIDIGKEYGKTIQAASAQAALHELIKALSPQGKVVLLIDECDQPLHCNTEHAQQAQKNLKHLKEFLTGLDALDNDLAFVFITGVGRYELNKELLELPYLQDITLSPDYATLLGFTEREIRTFFTPHLENLAEQHAQTPDAILKEMHKWCGGYRFSKAEDFVYNSRPTLQYLEQEHAQHYTIDFTIPRFLMKEITKEGLSPKKFNVVEIREHLPQNGTLNKVDLPTLMWHCGYLTIRAYNEDTHTYTLGYPNLEVKKAFLENMLEELTDSAPVSLTHYLIRLKDLLIEKNLEDFFVTLSYVFSNILSLKKEEPAFYYENIFFIMTQLIGATQQRHEKIPLDPTDTAVQTETTLYFFTCKVDGTAQDALTALQKEPLSQKYLDTGRELLLIGVGFSSEKHTISDWKCAVAPALTCK